MTRKGGGWRGRGRSGARWRDSRGSSSAEACQVNTRGTVTIKQEKQDEGYGDVKVKSFEEIMAEKRRRRLGQQTAARSSAAPGAATDVAETHSTPGRPKDSPVQSVRSAVSDPGGTALFPGMNNFNNSTGNINTTQGSWTSSESSTPVRPLASILKSSSSSSPVFPGDQLGFGTPIVYLDRLSQAQEDELSRVGMIRTPSNSPSPDRGSPSAKERTPKSKKKGAGKRKSGTKAYLGTSGEESTESSTVAVKVETDGGALGKFGDSSGLLGLRNLLRGSTNQRPGDSRTERDEVPSTSTSGLFSPVPSHTVPVETILSECRNPFELTQQQDVILIDSSEDEKDTKMSGHSSKGKMKKKRERKLKVRGGQQDSSLESAWVKKEPKEDAKDTALPNLSPLPNPLTFPYRNNTMDSGDIPEFLRNGPITTTSFDTPQEVVPSSSPEQPGTSDSSRNVWDIFSETGSNTSGTVSTQPVTVAELFVNTPSTALAVPTTSDHPKQTVPSVDTFDVTQLSRASSPDSNASYSVLLKSVQELSELDEEHQTSTYSPEYDVLNRNTEVTTLENSCSSLSQPPLVEAEYSYIELLNGQPEESITSPQAELSMPTLQPELPTAGQPSCNIPQTDSISDCMSSTQLCSAAHLVLSEEGIQNNMDLSPPKLFLDSPAVVETFPSQLDDHNRGGTEHISEAESSQGSQEDARRGETQVTQDGIERDKTNVEKNNNPLSKNPEVVISPSVNEDSEVDKLLSSFETLAMPMDIAEVQSEKTLEVADMECPSQSAKGGEYDVLQTVHEIPTKASSQLEAPTPEKTATVRQKPQQKKRQSARLRKKSGRSTQVEHETQGVGQDSSENGQSSPQLKRKSSRVKSNAPQVEQKLPQVKPDSPSVEEKSPQVQPNSPENTENVRHNSPQVKKSLPQVKANSPQVRRKSPRGKQDSPGLRKKTRRGGRTASSTGQDSPRVGQDSPQVGQDSPQVGQDSPQVGQNSPQLGQNFLLKKEPAEAEQNLPQVGQNSPQVEQNLPQVGQDLPQVGENSLLKKEPAEPEQNSPQLAETTPQLGHNPPQEPPEAKPKSPQVRRRSPRVEKKSPRVRKKTLRVKWTAPKPGNNPPQLGEDPPHLGHDPPQLGHDPPQLEEGPPQLGDDPPQLGHDPPQLGDDPPQLGHDPPQLGHDPPQLGHDPPQLGHDPPQLRHDPSQLGQDPPQLGQDPPQLGQDPPQLGQDPSQLGQDPPQLGQDPPQLEHDPPQLKGDPPQLEDDPPQLGDDPPQLQGNQLQLGDGPPQKPQKAKSPKSQQVKRKSPRVEQDSPRVRKKTAPQPANNLPQLGHDPPQKPPQVKPKSRQVRRKSPRGEQNSPQLEHDPPQLGNDPPQLEGDPPQKPPQVKPKSRQVRRKSPRVEQNSPRGRKKAAPQPANSPPQLGDGPLQMGGDPPQKPQAAKSPRVKPKSQQVRRKSPRVEQNSPCVSKETAPQRAHDPPQLGHDPPQLEGNPPQLGHDPPQLRDDPPQLGHDPPQLRDDPPQLGDNPPQKPPQVKPKSQQVKRKSPRVEQNSPQVRKKTALQPANNPPQLGDDPPQLGDVTQKSPKLSPPRKSLSQEDEAINEGFSSSESLQQLTKPGKRKQNSSKMPKKVHKSHHQKPAASTPFIPLSPGSNDYKVANSTTKSDKDVSTSEGVRRSMRRQEEAATGSPRVFRSDLARVAGSTSSNADSQHAPVGGFEFSTPSMLSRHGSPSVIGTTSTPAYSKENQPAPRDARAPSLSPIVCSSSPFTRTTQPEVSYASSPGNNGSNLRLISLGTSPRTAETSLSARSPFLSTASPRSSPFGSSDAGYEGRHAVASSSHDKGSSVDKTRSFSQSYITVDTTRCSATLSESESEEKEVATTPEPTSARKVMFGMPEDLRVKLNRTQREVKRTMVPSPQKSWVSLATGGVMLQRSSPAGCSDNDDAISLFVSRDEACFLIDDDMENETSRDTQLDNSPAAKNTTSLPSVQQAHRQKPSPVVCNPAEGASNSPGLPDQTDARVHRTQGGLIVKLPQRTLMKRKGVAMHGATGPDETQTAGPSSPKRLRTAVREGARPMEMERNTGRGAVQQTAQYDKHGNRCLPLPFGYCRQHFLSLQGCSMQYHGCKFDHRLTSKTMARDLIDYVSGKGLAVPLTVYRDYIRLLILAGDTAEAVATFRKLRNWNSGELTAIVDELTDNLLSMQCWGYLQEVLLLVLQKGIMPNENVLCELIQHHGDYNNILAIRQLMDKYDECNVRPGDNVLLLVDGCLAGPDRPPSRDSLTSEEDVDDRHHRHFSRVQSERRGIAMETVRADPKNAAGPHPAECPTGIQDKPGQSLWPDGACGTVLQEPSRSHTPLGIVNPQPHYTMESFIQRFQLLAKSRVPMEELGKQLGMLYTSMKTTVGTESSGNVDVLRALCDAVSSQDCFSEVFHAMVKTLGYSGEDDGIILYTEDIVPLGRVAVSLLLEARQREAWEQGFYMLYLMHEHSMLYDELPGLSDGWSEEDRWRVSNAALQMCLKSDNVGSALEVLKGRDDSWQCPPESLGPVFEERRCLLQEILTAVSLKTENAEDYFTLMDTIKGMGVNLDQQWMEILKQNLSDETVNLVALVSEQMMRRGLLDVRTSGEEDMREILSSLVDVLGRNKLEDEARKIFLHGCLQGMYKIPLYPEEGKRWDLFVPFDLKATEMQFYVERHFQFLGHDLMKGKFEGNHLTITLWHSTVLREEDAEGRTRLKQALQDGFGFKHGMEFIGQVVRGCFTVVMYYSAILGWLQRTDVVVDGSTSGMSDYEMEEDSPMVPPRPPSQCSVDTHFSSLTNVVNRMAGYNPEGEEEDSPGADSCNPDVLNRLATTETRGKQNENASDRGQVANITSYMGTSGQANLTQQIRLNSSLPPAQVHSSNAAVHVRAENGEMHNRNQVFNQPRNVPRPAHDNMQQFGNNGSQVQAQVLDRRGTQHIPELLSLQLSSNSIPAEFKRNPQQTSLLGEYCEPSQGPLPNLRGMNPSGARPQLYPYPAPQQQPGLPRFPVARAMPLVGSRKDNVNNAAGYHPGQGQLQARRNDVNNPPGFRMGLQQGHRNDVNPAARFPMGLQQGCRNDMNNPTGFRAGPQQGGRNDTNNIAGFRMGPPHTNNPGGLYMGPQQGRRYQGLPQHSQARGDGINRMRQDGGRIWDTPSPPPPPPPPPLPSHQGYVPGMKSPPKSFKTVSRPKQGPIDIFIRRIREEIEGRLRTCGQIAEEYVSTVGCRLLDRFLQEEGQALFQRPQFNMELQRRIFKFVDCHYRQECPRSW